MDTVFKPTPTAEGWQLSNPTIMSLACIRASFDVLSEAGGVGALRTKSIQLTKYFEDLLLEKLGDKIRLITPKEESARGCQLSFEVSEKYPGKKIFDELESNGFVSDWRYPNVIRAAAVPLYNSYEDVFLFVSALEERLQKAEK